VRQRNNDRGNTGISEPDNKKLVHWLMASRGFTPADNIKNRGGREYHSTWLKRRRLTAQVMNVARNTCIITA